MKKLLSLLIVGLFALSMVSASINIDGVTLDGQTSLIVEENDLVPTEVTVTTSGLFDNWESTAYMIEGTGWTCVNTADHTNDGTYSESFTITIPPLVSGDYDFSVRTYQYSDSCSGDIGDSFTLSNGIIVEEAPACEITMVLPDDGQYYADNVPIEWSLSPECTSPTYNLHFFEGSCEPSNPTLWDEIIDSVNALDYAWVSGIEDSQVCVRVSEDEGDEFATSGLFYIDNLPPIANVSDKQCNEGETIILNASNSEDLGQFPSGIVSWNWDLDEDGQYDDASGATVPYLCVDGDAIESISVEVTDAVGNSDSADAEVEILNVNPVCQGIIAPSDVPLIDGQVVVNFIASATDVAADLPLNYNWDFDDSSSLENGDEVSHIYTEAKLYNVSVLVSDKDGGETMCSVQVDVVEPTPLDNQEVAAYYNLEANFGLNAGAVVNSFVSGLENLDTCNLIVNPANMDINKNGNDCVVNWNNPRPTNDEQGVHPVAIKVTNGTDYEYYSFTVTVWSWIIDLEYNAQNQGWNFISIPYVPEDESISAVILDQLYDVLPSGTEYSVYSYQYNGVDNVWLKSRRSGYGDLYTISPGYGYWIKVTEDAKLRGNGKQLRYASPGLPPEIDVPTNQWAMVGRYGIIGDNEGSMCNPHAGSIPKWDALESVGRQQQNELHLYGIDSEGHMDTKYSLRNNKGYLLWIENEHANNVQVESYAPLDKYYTEEYQSCTQQPI